MRTRYDIPMSTWFSRISFKAVALGGVVDIVATNLLMLPIVLPILGTTSGSTPAAGGVTSALTSALNDRPAMFLTAMLLGAAASILGGCFAARVAGREYLLHGALSAWACAGVGAFGWGAAGDTISRWQHVAFIVLSPALGALGGGIYASQVRRWPRLATPLPWIDAARSDASAPLRGGARVLYAINRTIWVLGLLLGLLFGCMLVFALVRQESTMILGAAILFGICVGSILLARAGAIHLRAASPRHWGFQIGSLVLILLPIAAMAMPIVAARSK
jgi:hypothetical protein